MEPLRVGFRRGLIKTAGLWACQESVKKGSYNLKSEICDRGEYIKWTTVGLALLPGVSSAEGHEDSKRSRSN